ncbi:hypothetical protein ACFW1A_40620, partial [Kitasatospora sp. NPDC058965]|uniref:hypothetical protein n=1 Tax=Kitasatospora sp. NPDC058965 TaxID=3346682 RepID=UPI00368BA981
RIAVWLVPVLALTACSGSSGAGEPAVPIGAIPVVTSPDQIVRPISDYLASPRQAAVLQDAANAVTAQCMRDFGLPSSPTLLVGSDTAVRDLLEHTHLYGFFDPAGAAISGYNMVRLPPAGGQGTAPLSADAIAVEFGRDASGRSVTTFGNKPVPAGGCKAKGIEAIGGPLPGIDASALPNGGPKEPLEDPRVSAATAQWSACMKVKGYHYETPFEATTSPITQPQRLAGSEAVPHSAEEIAQAKADIDCKLSTNLIGIDLAVQTAYDKSYIDSNVTVLSEYRQQIEDRVRKATQILSANTTPSG